MSFSVTGLQLVNRVRRRRRMPDITSIVETEDLMALDALNGAIEDVLSGERWEFDQRSAQLRLKGRNTGGSIGGTSPGSDSFTYKRSGVAQSEFIGDFILRIVPNESQDTPNSALRVLRSNGVVVLDTLSGVFAVPFAETASFPAGTDLDSTLIYAEYMLPDTVRSVIRVKHQEKPLTLKHVDPTLEFDEMFPRPHIEYGEPRMVSVGGYDIPTYNSFVFPDVANPPTPQLRMVVWPVPDDDYLIDYTYQYRHPELVDAASKLDGVPPSVVDKIVKVAAEDMTAYYEKNVENAMAMRRMTMAGIQKIHANHTGAFAERRVMGNWDGSRSRYRGYPGIFRGRIVEEP